MNKTFLIALAACAVLGTAVPARAELVFFTSGRSMSVKGHREESGSVVLMLRAGGEMVFEPAAIARITPDEVPYPEPEVEAPPSPVVPAAAVLPAVPYGDIIERVAKEQNVDVKLVR